MVLAPLLAVALVLTAAAGVVGLAQRGPLGWLAAALLVVLTPVAAVAATSRARRWWRSTRAPARPVRRRP